MVSVAGRLRLNDIHIPALCGYGFGLPSVIGSVLDANGHASRVARCAYDMFTLAYEVWPRIRDKAWARAPGRAVPRLPLRDDWDLPGVVAVMSRIVGALHESHPGVDLIVEGRDLAASRRLARSSATRTTKALGVRLEMLARLSGLADLAAAVGVRIMDMVRALGVPLVVPDEDLMRTPEFAEALRGLGDVTAATSEAAKAAAGASIERCVSVAPGGVAQVRLCLEIAQRRGYIRETVAMFMRDHPTTRIPSAVGRTFAHEGVTGTTPWRIDITIDAVQFGDGGATAIVFVKRDGFSSRCRLAVQVMAAKVPRALMIFRGGSATWDKNVEADTLKSLWKYREPHFERSLGIVTDIIADPGGAKSLAWCSVAGSAGRGVAKSEGWCVAPTPRRVAPTSGRRAAGRAAAARRRGRSGR